MKNCMECRYCGKECYEDSIYSCELFGEDIPEWASNYNDGCLLKIQEVKKLLKISSGLRQLGTGKLDKYGYPKWTKEDTKHNQKVMKEYNEYLEVLKKRLRSVGRMNNEEYEFTLQDVKSIIQSKNQIYDFEHRGSISFSGGSDSMLMHCLIDESLPNNNIPRIYMNTGIEHQAMRKYVQELAKKDKRFIILTPKVNIPRMLKKDGYPFKSKQHSQNYGVYFRNKEKIENILNEIENKPELKFNYDFIHNLGKGTKSIIKYVLGIREKRNTDSVVEREREHLYEYADCP